MKKILMILFLIIPFCVNAQTDRDILLEIVKQQAKVAEQQTETNKLVTELAKQQAKLSEQIIATNLEVRGISTEVKAIDKRFDMLLSVMIGIGGTLFAGIFGIVMMVFWDRRTALKPFEAKTDELKLENSVLKKEVDLLKEKELKHLEREMKVELYIKQISQIDNRFAPFNP